MAVFTPSSVILYVGDVEASAAFYRTALEREPVETYPDFTVFALTDDVTLGLQARAEIDPAAEGGPGSTELSMSYASRQEVDQIYAAWKELGFTMVLEPTVVEFGYTFVAADPDGHRLRVCATDPSGPDRLQ